ncbi:unnamed protein product [Pedinophyceae sp. YPF-701]|nr:unnamed protein product [Pedinophyceae sp. YPF-701]
MDFASSTHKRDWIFTRESLEAARASVRQRSQESYQAAVQQERELAASSGKPDAVPEPQFLTDDDEFSLRVLLSKQIQKFCQQLALPPKVAMSACVLFHRFYARRSLYDYRGPDLAFTCMVVACKAEDCPAFSTHEIPFSLERFGDRLGELKVKCPPKKELLRLEPAVLEAVGFSLMVYTPAHAVAALAHEAAQLVAQKGPVRGPDGKEVSGGELRKLLEQAALGAAQQCLVTDAPLLHPPGTIALAALRSAFRSTKTPGFESVLVHFARASVESGGCRHGEAQPMQVTPVLRNSAPPPQPMSVDHNDPPGASDTPRASEDEVTAAAQRLRAAIDAIDALVVRAVAVLGRGADARPTVDAKQLMSKYARCRNPLYDPSSKVYKQRQAKIKQEKRAREKSKMDAAAEARRRNEDALLGFGDGSTAGAKRPRQ